MDYEGVWPLNQDIHAFLGAGIAGDLFLWIARIQPLDKIELLQSLDLSAFSIVSNHGSKKQRQKTN